MNCKITCSKFYGCKVNSQVGPKCGFFQWVDNHTCRDGMKLPHLSFKGPICLRINCSLQLKGKGQLGKEEKATKRERKAHELYVEVREKAMRARENVQACTSGIMGIFCICNVGFVFCLNQKNKI